MPAPCPKCGSRKLIKNKKLKAYFCKRHGLIRYIVPEYVMLTAGDKINHNKLNLIEMEK